MWPTPAASNESPGSVITLRMNTVLIGIIKLGHSNEHPFSTTRLSRQISFGDDDDDVDDDER